MATVTIQMRRGIAAQWTGVNPVLNQGELGVELDTLKLKAGDGVTAWAALPYVSSVLGINVKDYGAAGNGIANDGPALQTALAVASANSEPLILPPGTYLTDRTLPLSNHVMIIGQTALGDVSAPGVVIRAANGTNLDAVIATPNWINNTNASAEVNLGLIGVAVDGNRANQTSGQGHGFVSTAWRTVVKDCTVLNCRGDGIRVTSLMKDGATQYPNTIQISETRINRNVVYNCAGNGIAVVEGTNVGRVTDGFCLENIAYQVTGRGISLMQGGDWIVEHNHTYGTGSDGIWVDQAADARIVSNYAEYWGEAASVGNVRGIYVRLGWDAIVNDNVVNGVGASLGAGNTPFGLLVENFPNSEAHLMLNNNLVSYAGTAAGTGVTVNKNGGSGTFYCVGKGSNFSQGYTTASNFAAGLTLTGGIIV